GRQSAVASGDGRPRRILGRIERARGCLAPTSLRGYGPESSFGRHPEAERPQSCRRRTNRDAQGMALIREPRVRMSQGRVAKTAAHRFKLDASRQAIAAYVYGPGDVPVEQITGTTALYFPQDELGSTRAITSSSGGVQATCTFQPFGQLAS